MNRYLTNCIARLTLYYERRHSKNSSEIGFWFIFTIARRVHFRRVEFKTSNGILLRAKKNNGFAGTNSNDAQTSVTILIIIALLVPLVSYILVTWYIHMNLWVSLQLQDSFTYWPFKNPFFIVFTAHAGFSQIYSSQF